MREYGKIKTEFWSQPEVRELSDGAKLLYVYLIACSHGNSIGCFVLPLEYVVGDLSWSLDKVKETVSELLANGFAYRDERTRVIRIRSWWKHNTIENPNVARSAMSSWEKLPDCHEKAGAAKDLLSATNRLDNGCVTVLERFIEQFRNNETDKEPETEPEPDLLSGSRRTLPTKKIHEMDADEGFKRFYAAYPRHQSKRAAYKAWKSAIRSTDPETIIAAASKYAISRRTEDSQFTPLPASWLNAGKWDDEPMERTNARPNSRPVPLSGFAAAYAKLGSADYEGGGEASLPLLPSGP